MTLTEPTGIQLNRSLIKFYRWGIWITLIELSSRASQMGTRPSPPLRGHSAGSGDIFGCHGRDAGAPGMWRVETRDPTPQPTVQDASPQTVIRPQVSARLGSKYAAFSESELTGPASQSNSECSITAHTAVCACRDSRALSENATTTLLITSQSTEMGLTFFHIHVHIGRVPIT